MSRPVPALLRTREDLIAEGIYAPPPHYAEGKMQPLVDPKQIQPVNTAKPSLTDK
jgi:hypothetical protein